MTPAAPRPPPVPAPPRGAGRTRGARPGRTLASEARGWRAALLAIALMAGCRGGRDAVHVESVRVAQGALAEPLRAAGVGEPELASTAKDALLRAGFRVGGGGRRAFRARVDVLSARVVRTGGGALRVELAVELELVPARGPGDPLREDGRVSRIFGAESAAAAWRHALSGAAERAALGLAAALAADEKPRPQLLDDLEADDPRARAHAARVLGLRRDAAAVPALVDRLEDESPEVAERAIQALARIGDRRAVPPLIEASRRGDAAKAARLAHVIGALGGGEAEGYLLTVEAGHPDPRVRRAAREALAELDAREADADRVADGR